MGFGYTNSWKTFKRIDNHRGPFSVCQFSALLHHILINSHKADYVEQISIENWYVRFYRPGEDTEDSEDEEYDEFYSPHPYSESKMEAFENAVRNSESIPCEEKEHWISRLNAGDENLVLALLLPRLHYLTSIKIAIKDMDDEFLLPTLKRLAKEPRSSSLSRLLEVEIEGTIRITHPLGLLAIFAALPSVTSLKGCELARRQPLKVVLFCVRRCSIWSGAPNHYGLSHTANSTIRTRSIQMTPVSQSRGFVKPSNIRRHRSRSLPCDGLISTPAREMRAASHGTEISEY